MTEAVSTLICKDAGTAGGTLLARKDLRVRWALTEAEAEAVIQWTRCAVCIARAPLAMPVLAACARANREINTIVLLEPAQWASWGDYFRAGAGAVLQASAADQVLDAMADATGIPIRTARRVPFRTEVRFALGEEGGAWWSVNVSKTGICILDFPPLALGAEVDLTFDVGGQPFEINAIVAQILRVGPQRAVGLSFGDISPELAAALDHTIQHSRAGSNPIFDVVGELDPLDEATIHELRLVDFQGDRLAVMRALTSRGAIDATDEAAPWLVAACRALSAVEVAAIRDPDGAPPWAQDAVLARLRVYRTRAEATVPSAADVRLIFGLCQRLADSAAGSDGPTLVQVATIRGQILRVLYDPDLADEL